MHIGIKPSLFVLCIAVAGATPSWAQSRPDESDLFGDAPAAADAGQPPTFGQPPASAEPSQEGSLPKDEDSRVGEVFAAPSKNKFESAEAVEDPLKIGGLFYGRYFLNWADQNRFRDVKVSSPNLLDVYMDVRPSDRIRGFVRGRMKYDPAFDPTAQTTFAPTTTIPRATSNPAVLLDQFWLNFDIARTVFVTAGKQHVRWTVSRFFQPTDFLSPQKRDPLAVFDERTGASLVKFHLPIESLGWNFYAITLFDNFGPANALGKLGEALKAEMVFGQTEIALMSVFQSGRYPRYGLNVSSGLGPFDVYLESAYQPRFDQAVWRIKPGRRAGSFADEVTPFLAQLNLPNLAVDNPLRPTLAAFADQSAFELATPNHVFQTTLGASWTVAYSDTDTLILGAEYFYNGRGYANPVLFPVSVFGGTYAPFYAGTHYLGAYANLVGPGRLDNGTFVLSTLGNLSDLSFITRLDFIYRALSFLQIESFAAVHYGGSGEFNFGLRVPPQTGAPPEVLQGVNPTTAALLQRGLFVPHPILDLGISARISL